jgi:3-phenylpropionate/trans-cinnamate dioxygenase ferredoxin reductase subunit
MRDIADADRLAPSWSRAAGLVVGGGYIGLEAAAVCAKKGLAVTLVEMAPRNPATRRRAETSDYFRTLHAAPRRDDPRGRGPGRLLATTRAGSAARCCPRRGDRLRLVSVGVGITPDTRLAESAGIAVADGISVDPFGRTSASHVWAAGDCASFPHGDGRMRLESVGHAIDQAEQVARNILGADEPYAPKPWFWSDQYDTKLQIAGLNHGHDRVVTRRAGEGPDAVSHWYFRGDRLVAVDAMNDSRAYMIGKRLIEAGRSPAPEAIADPATDLKALLKA